MKSFTGADFRDWRVKHRLTQERAGAAVGVTVHSVRKWEQGSHLPPKNVALLVAHLRPEDLPPNPRKPGNRPIGIATRSRRKKSDRT